MENMQKTWLSGTRIGLNGLALKLIACAVMVVDHVGVILFPSVAALRIVGRLAFPLFAFTFAEGDRYTRRPLLRIAQIAVLGGVCEAVYVIATGAWYGNILLTLACSSALAWLLRQAKVAAFGDEVDRVAAVGYAAAFVLAAFALACFTYTFLRLDYGFAGVMTSVLIGAFDFHGLRPPTFLARLDCFTVRLVCALLALLWVSFASGWLTSPQPWCLLALPIMACYDGISGMPKTGKYLPALCKYAFYAFYPLHLLVIFGISFLT